MALRMLQFVSVQLVARTTVFQRLFILMNALVKILLFSCRISVPSVVLELLHSVTTANSNLFLTSRGMSVTDTCQETLFLFVVV